MRPVLRCLILGLLAVSGCTTASNYEPSLFSGEQQVIGTTVLTGALPEPTTAADGNPQIVANDVLTVNVYGAAQLDRTVQVDANGEIALPLVGSIEAAGASHRELENTIALAYARDYLQSPQVSVFVKESVGQQVTVDGEVNRAGIYPVTARTTLLQVIAQAGNFTSLANNRKVLVFRPSGGLRYVAVYDVVALRNGRSPDPHIFGGDMVVVPSSAAKLVRHELKDLLGAAASVGSLAALGL
ncbi:MAG TPA: polysaccharide biosynthesis/export family protein [Tianweitania sediminis]|nr:polysaccharide biosynthesis/export family protein [Tianweitania sediminis]